MAHPSLSRSNFIIDVFRSFIDIIYPPQCLVCSSHAKKNGICTSCIESFKGIKEPLCSCCGVPFKTIIDKNHSCGLCIKESVPFDRAVSIYLFEGKLSEAIRRLKYSGKVSVASTLGDLISNHPITHEEYDAVVPVPLYMGKLRERGFNQSHLLAARVANRTSANLHPYILERVRPTLPQVGMKSSERVQNVKGAFMIRKGADAKEKKILLIDDVYTTGATAKECSRVLKRGGAAKVNVLTLARVVEG